jgi:hypothetical protein
MLGKALLSASVSASAPGAYVEDVFSTYLYTGNDSPQTITNGIDLAGEGGMVWQKRRSSAGDHFVMDTERDPNYFIYTNFTNEEGVGTSGSSFNSDGFTIGAENNLHNTNDDVVSWTFRKAEKFFDVVTYTGNGVAGRTVSHNLGSEVGCLIVKRTDTTGEWMVWHKDVAAINASYALQLQSTSAAAGYSTSFNSTAPTSTEFTLGNNSKTNNASGTYVAYLFAHDAGGFGDAGTDNVISCGSYTGNGSADGPEIDLGWEPQWVLFRRVTGVEDWIMFDNMRGMVVGGIDPDLRPNQSQAEGAFVNYLEPNATGFKLTDANSRTNENGDTYIYIAIRRGPMRAPTSGTEVLESVAYTGDGSSNRTIGSSLTPDFVLWMDRDATSAGWSSYAQGIWDRIRGEDVLLPTSNADGESTGWANTYFNLDQQVGWSNGTNSSYTNNSGTDYVTHHLRRAPGFFDVVCYSGDGTYPAARAIPHNLGVAPELMIYKCRSASVSWEVQLNVSGSDYLRAYLDTNLAAAGSGSSLPYGGYAAAPDASNIYVRDAGGNVINGSGQTYIAYLFATLAGVSKVGSYTGTGTTLSIDCGFTAGARFVLIKRTDSTGDWYFWDTARGIVSGDDPYLLLNSNAAEVTNTDYIDPLSSGFQISSTAPAAINASGGTYIFLAIA